MNGSLVMPKMAGTLSTANSTSVLSTTNSTRNSGVMQQLAVLDDEEPLAVVFLGDAERAAWQAASASFSRDRRSLSPCIASLIAGVNQERAEDPQDPFESMRSARRPARMNASRMTTAPRMPQNSTRY